MSMTIAKMPRVSKFIGLFCLLTVCLILGWFTSSALADDSQTQQAVVADASTRTSLNSEMNSGYDNGFFIHSPDSAFSLNINAVTQFRYVATFDDGSVNNNSGFDFNYNSIWFSGSVHKMNYWIEGQFTTDSSNENSDGDFNLHRAWVDTNVADNVVVKFGQFDDVFLREGMIHESQTLGVNRSEVYALFGQGESQGVIAYWTIDRATLSGSFTDGFNSENTAWNEDDSTLAGTVRFDYDILGDHVQNFSSLSNDGDLNWNAGASIHGQGNDYDTDTQMVAWTVDSELQWNELSGQIGYVGNNTDTNGEETDNWGLFAQTSYLIAKRHEPFVQYNYLALDDNEHVSSDNQSFASVGYNYYIYGNAAKFTTDCVIPFQNTEGLTELGTFDTLGFSTNGNTDFIVRMQIQLMF